jgi:hypothetical protein
MARKLLTEALTHEMSENAKKSVLHALSMMTRVHTKPKTASESHRVTREMAAKVLQHYKNHPDQSCRAIGEIFTINQGRVSEIIAGGLMGLKNYEP